MDNDQVKGKMKDIEGRIQRQAGEWTGSEENQAKGMGKQAEGKLENAFGKAKDAGKNAMDKAEQAGRDLTDKTGGNRNLPKDEHSDVRPRRDMEKPGPDVVPDRDEDIGEEVA